MKILWRLSRETSGYRLLLVISAVSLIATSVLSLFAPRILTTIIGIIQGGVDKSAVVQILKLSALLLAVYAVAQLLRAVNNIVAHKAAWNIVENVRVKVYGKIQSFSTAYFSQAHTGDLMSRIVTDTGTLEELYAHIIPSTVSDVLTLVGVTAILFTMNPSLAAITCIPIPLLVISSLVFVKKIRPIFRERQIVLGDINTRLHDSFDGIREIRAFGQEKREETYMRTEFHKFTHATLKGLIRGAYYGPSLVLLGNLGTVLVLSFGGFLSSEGQISPAFIVGFLFYLNLFYAPIMSLAERMEPAQGAIAGAERVCDLLDTEITVKDQDGSEPIEHCTGAIEFRDVSFSYEDSQPILTDINIAIKPGSFTAFVGPTGVGKTTMVNLISRMYDPTQGAVLLDGVDLREVTLASLRKQIAYVPQDTFLFNTSIAENIAFARPDATREEIIAAAKIARIHRDIEAMPQGYESVTGERGVKLSGGQKQRIAIARAIICRAPILILDEATSAVDAETERMIQRSIDELTGSRTIIAIAHRISTVISADNIAFFEGGRIIEQGTHDELIELDGRYAELYRLQTTEAG